MDSDSPQKPGAQPDAWELLDKYLAGEGTAEEQASLAAQFDEAPLIASDLRAELARNRSTAPDVHESLKRMHARLDKPIVRPIRSSRLETVIRIAAMVFIVIGAAVIWNQYGTRPKSTPTQTIGSHEYATLPSQRAEIQLIDGTHVLLGANSRMRVLEGYNDHARDIYLEGQAYFRVQHDSLKRFVVHTTHGSTEDIGTEFAVTAYRSDTSDQVVVAQGKVAVATLGDGSRQAVVLSRGDAGWMTQNRPARVEHGVSIDAYLAWTQGRLVFDNTPLPDVIVQLQRWYNVKLVVTDPSLQQATVTASFVDKPITAVMETLAPLLDANYVQDGQVIRLYKARHTPQHTR